MIFHELALALLGALLPTFFSTGGIAAPPAPRTESALTHELKDRIFTARLAQGYHFNENAPNRLQVDQQKLKARKLAPRETEFGPLPESWASATAQLYVCDDAVTFCEPRTITLRSGTTALPEKKPEPLKSSKLRINSHGFIEDNLDAAIEQATRKKQLVLIDFSARWCPGCIRMESEIFPSPKFKEHSRNYVLVKLDVDRFENAAITEKYHVQGIPTLLVLNANQEELDRIYDYQPIETISQFFSSLSRDPTSILQLKEKASSGDAALLLQVGKRLLASGKPDEALAYLSKVQPSPPELPVAQVEAAKSTYKKDPSSGRAPYVQALRSAIQAEPSSSRSIAWRTELIGLLEDKKEIEALRQQGLAVADALLSDSSKLREGVKNDLVGEFTGYEPLLVASARAELASEAQDDTAAVEKSWKEAAAFGRRLRITARTPGPALRYLLVLTQAKEFEEADRLALSILKSDASNVEIQRRRIKILMGLKKYPEAIRVAEQVLRKSYDRNEFWVAESLAKAYLASDRKSDAIRLLDRYLARDDSEWAHIQNTRKSLEKLRKTAVAQQ
jgi:tetratricopeptide (TPR) repeat protein